MIDTHIHLDDEAFDADRDELIRGMASHGIALAVNIGADPVSSLRSLRLAEAQENIFAVVGVHPSYTGTMTDDDLSYIADLARHPKVLAIGEIGLDYYWKEPEQAIQIRRFKEQLDLAKSMKLPVVIHSRDAAQDTLQIIKEEGGGAYGGVMHCYAYSKEHAGQYLSMGFHLGIGGVVTFKNAKKLKEVVEYAPLSSLLLETDAPYLSPVPNRGKRNSFYNLPYIVEAIAQIKRISPEEVVEATSKNARDMYKKLPQPAAC